MSEEKTQEVWWQKLLSGIGMIAIAIFLYWYFVDFENSADTSRRMNAILAILYSIGGKNLTCGLIAVFGCLYCFSGIRDYIQQKK